MLDRDRTNRSSQRTNSIDSRPSRYPPTIQREEFSLRSPADMGMKAYRFSTAWPRVMPDGTGKINPKGLDFYDRLVDKLLEKKIVPFITLYHWDHPQALEDKGGLRNKETAYAFAEYAKVVVGRLSDRVTNWMTMNEMPCSAIVGYRTQMNTLPEPIRPTRVHSSTSRRSSLEI